MFVRTALKKKTQYGGMVSLDRRGYHAPPNKISDDIRDGVKKHIESFPAIESHYSREETVKKYLGNELNISKMYKLYVDNCKEHKVPSGNIAKHWLYSEIFNNEFNLAFKEPANDSCDICDEFIIKIKNSTIKEEACLQKNYEAHLDEAKLRYAEKKKDKLEAKETGCKKKTIMVDLQKCLPTPYLTNGQSFYLRKLWTLNLTIHDDTLNKATCVLWDETKGGRGGNEIASCVLKWALQLKETESNIEELNIWSDNCAGQNRNFMIVTLYMWLLKKMPNLKIINHKFLLRGHTHMEVDSDHSIIERAKKKIEHSSIMTPWDLQQFIRSCKNKNPFEVINMELEDFLDFQCLYNSKNSPLIYRRKEVKISEIVHLRLEKEKEGLLMFKTDFAEKEFKTVSLNRTTRSSVWPEHLPQVTSEPKPISKLKYKDLQTALKWVPRIFHDFYTNMKYDDKIADYPE